MQLEQEQLYLQPEHKQSSLLLSSSLINIATVLKYTDKRRAIINNVDKTDRKPFSKLRHFMIKIPKNA